MAEIHIEQKKSNIWPWIIGLIVLALIAWALYAMFDRDDNDVAVAPVTPAATAVTPPAATPAAVDPTPLTDVAAIVTVPDRMPLVGRSVQLTGVPVQSVPGDETFWVGTNETQRLFVALDPVPGTRTPEESPTDVNPGQRVTVSGVIRQVPADLGAMRTRWKLDDAAVAALNNARVYLAANQVSVDR